jgi:DNA-binding FrmR family transcriptional regulator
VSLKSVECSSCTGSEAVKIGESHHPDHANSKRRINRAKGQLDAVARMIDDRRYCPDIIVQIRAATNAMKALEQEILKAHLEGCVKSAFESKDPTLIAEKVAEILRLTTQ